MIVVLSSMGGFIVLAITLGTWADGKLSAEKKNRLASTLRATGETGSLSIAGRFLIVFDTVFDPEQRGRPLFVRSGIASCVLLLVLSLRWMAVHQDRSREVLTSSLDEPWRGTTIAALAVFVLVLNWLGDYLSLWETRAVMSRMAAVRSWPFFAWWLLVDLVATVVIYCAGTGCAMFVLGRFEQFELDLDGFLETLAAVFLEGGVIFRHTDRSFDAFALFFHTSLFTSVWAWALMLGTLLWSWTFGSRVFRGGAFSALYEKAPVTCWLIYGSVFLGCVLGLLQAAFSLLGGGGEADAVLAALR